jgi:hypothetical protein
MSDPDPGPVRLTWRGTIVYIGYAIAMPAKYPFNMMKIKEKI